MEDQFALKLDHFSGGSTGASPAPIIMVYTNFQHVLSINVSWRSRSPLTVAGRQGSQRTLSGFSFERLSAGID